MSAAPRLVAVVGPTATGKSDLGLALAAALGGEVVNADAMQLYRGMDIGTAKLTPAERAGVPHHLLDVLDVTETASVAAYQRAAREPSSSGCGPPGGPRCWSAAPACTCRRCSTSWSSPAPTRGCGPSWRPSWPIGVRRRCTPGWPSCDPAAAAAVLPSNGRRIVRALEVIALTGRPFPAAAAQPRRPAATTRC